MSMMTAIASVFNCQLIQIANCPWPQAGVLGRRGDDVYLLESNCRRSEWFASLGGWDVRGHVVDDVIVEVLEIFLERCLTLFYHIKG